MAAAGGEHHHRGGDDAQEKRREPGCERLPHRCIYVPPSPVDWATGSAGRQGNEIARRKPLQDAGDLGVRRDSVQDRLGFGPAAHENRAVKSFVAKD